MRSRLSWTSLAAVLAVVLALVFALVPWQAEAVLPLCALGVVLALIALRE